MTKVFGVSLALAVAVTLCPAALAATEKPPSDGAITLLVMDPLALPLSCPCVAGYAQRKYEVLGEYLSKRLGRPVVVDFAESIDSALEKEKNRSFHIIIGKDSVVRAQGEKHKLEPALLARLVGKDGKTTMTGLIVVRSEDPAKTVSDLAGYRIIFGPQECDEKFAAARKLLEEGGVKLGDPKDAETSAACSDGACMIIDWGDKVHGAAVISSYAAPLLEGCGTVKKGALRVVGETKPVPFVAAFATNLLNEKEQAEVQKALYEAREAPGMLVALETLIGFVPKDFKAPVVPKRDQDATAPKTPDAPSAQKAGAASEKDAAAINQTWPGWLGPNRNGRVGWLPHELPDEPRIVWRHPLGRAGMGGLAATDRRVFVGDRDAANRSDVFRCLDAVTGDELWIVSYPAPGRLDYDNSPRATPLILGDRVYFFGAFGDFTCAKIDTGDVVWRANVRLKFLAIDPLQWGTCSSPLAVDDMIIVNPGAPTASIVALDAATGAIRWKSPGEPQGHSSFILATLSGVRQIVGYTKTKLVGLDPATGRQLWSLTPRIDGDFNVPTPQVVGDKLLVASENNGARLYGFHDNGQIIDGPIAASAALNPQMSTPVAIGERIFCVNRRLECFDTVKNLASVWKVQERAFPEYAPILASNDRLLVVGRGGELILLDASTDEPRILSRCHIASTPADRTAELLTFPALVGRRLYVRCEHEVVAIDL